MKHHIQISGVWYQNLWNCFIICKILYKYTLRLIKQIRLPLQCYSQSDPKYFWWRRRETSCLGVCINNSSPFWTSWPHCQGRDLLPDIFRTNFLNPGCCTPWLDGAEIQLDLFLLHKHQCRQDQVSVEDPLGPYQLPAAIFARSQRSPPAADKEREIFERMAKREPVSRCCHWWWGPYPWHARCKGSRPIFAHISLESKSTDSPNLGYASFASDSQLVLSSSLFDSSDLKIWRRILEYVSQIYNLPVVEIVSYNLRSLCNQRSWPMRSPLTNQRPIIMKSNFVHCLYTTGKYRIEIEFLGNFLLWIGYEKII